MPPVRPRISACVDESDKRKLEAMAKRLDVPVGWIVRQAVRVALTSPEIVLEPYLKSENERKQF